MSHGDQLTQHVRARNALRLPFVRAVTLHQLHLIRGHEPVAKLVDGLRSGRIVGFRVTDLGSLRDFTCDACALGRGVRISLSKLSRSRALRPLFRLFYDTLGPQKVYGFCGELYMSISINDCTRMTWHVKYSHQARGRAVANRSVASPYCPVSVACRLFAHRQCPRVLSQRPRLV